MLVVAHHTGTPAAWAKDAPSGMMMHQDMPSEKDRGTRTECNIEQHAQYDPLTLLRPLREVLGKLRHPGSCSGRIVSATMFDFEFRFILLIQITFLQAEDKHTDAQDRDRVTYKENKRGRE